MYLHQRIFLFLLLICFCGVESSRAEEPRSGFSVALADGSSHTFYFDEHPEITFDHGKINITSDNFEMSYERDEIADMKFENVQSGIAEVVRDNVSFEIKGNVIHVQGIPQYSQVSVYDINGIKVMELSPVSEQEVSVDLNPLSSGIYFVRIGNLQTIKFIKQY